MVKVDTLIKVECKTSKRVALDFANLHIQQSMKEIKLVKYLNVNVWVGKQ